MEDVQAYIESGILELYVLGDVTLEEKFHVEGMISKYPAIKQELEEIERSLELYARENAIEPPETHRQKILNSLLTNLANDDTFPTKTHTTTTRPATAGDERSNTNDNIVAFTTPGTSNFYKYAFAACMLLLIASIIALASVYNQLQQSNNQLLAVNAQNQYFSKTVNLLDHQLSVFRDPTFKMIKLRGTDKTPASAMTVAWSPVKRKVMIDMMGMKLPKNDQSHQYQLWAMVDGKPVDLGVFDKAAADTSDMKEMKSIASAEAFAVTLEPKGGSSSPTMSEMMAIGQF